MHDPRTGEPIARPGDRGAHEPYSGAGRGRDAYRHDEVEASDSGDVDTRDADTRHAGRGYHYPGGTRHADERAARERAHFDENRSWDPVRRDEFWRRGEYGSRLYGNVVGAATPSGTAGIRRYGPRGGERRGPKGYVRSDERLRDDICERLSDETWIDLSEVDVHVDDGRVRLEGDVNDRFSRYAIEDIVDGVWGVKDVDNRIRVRVA